VFIAGNSFINRADIAIIHVSNLLGGYDNISQCSPIVNNSPN